MTKNLRFLPLFGFLRWLEPLFPLYVIFASFYHLSYSEIFFTQIIFSLSIILFDLPLGVLGDLLGEEKLIRYGSFCYLIAVFLLVFNPGFVQFCMAEGLLGLAFAAYSGADTSLLFRSCQQAKVSYSEMESKVQFLARGAEGVSNVFAAVLAFFSIPALVLGSVVIAVIRLFLSFQFQGLTKSLSTENLFSAFKLKFASIIQGFKSDALKANWVLFFYSGFLGAIFIMNYWMMQIFLKELHLEISWIALINLAYYIISAYAARQAKLIFTHQRLFFILIPILLLIPLFALALQKTIWMLPLFAFVGIAFGFKMPFMYQQLHQISQDNVRASFLSLDNVITRVCFSLISYPIAQVIDNHGLSSAYIILVILLCLVMMMGLYLKMHKSSSI